jgi:flagella basal body P-ring formation protein FlgA
METNRRAAVHNPDSIGIEAGKVTSLEEADTVEVLVDLGSLPPQTHVDVDYVIGSESFKTRVKKGTTIGQFREALSYSRKSKQIVGIASEGTEIDKDDSVEDWLQ